MTQGGATNRCRQYCYCRL